MARTVEGRVLTEQHRQAQLRVRARAASDFVRLWPVWKGDDDSFELLAQASVALVNVHNQLSSSVAAGYFDRFRQAEQIPGRANAKIAGPPAEGVVLGTLHVTARDAVRNAIAGGKSPQAARQTALVRATGTVVRLTLDGGRTTIVDSALADGRALGYARVTAGQPCAFCVMLASRGPVYKEDTVDFEAHDHCSCAAEPHYPGSRWPGRGEEFRELYDRVAAGTDNPVNELRRALNGTA